MKAKDNPITIRFMMQYYCPSLTQISRLKTREVTIGHLKIGNGHPIRVQTMTTTDTLDTAATVEQTIRCIEAAQNLLELLHQAKKKQKIY